MTLYINACVRIQSRTNELAHHVLFQEMDRDIQEVNLQSEQIAPLDRDSLRHRNTCISHGQLNDTIFDYAWQFAQADTIVIAAPYWDLLFPANLRAYLERVCVVGVTFEYTESGEPRTLCKAKRLVYVTTAGGFIGETNLGFEYIKAIATQFFGIADIRLVQAEGLDIAGADVSALMERAKKEYTEYALRTIYKK